MNLKIFWTILIIQFGWVKTENILFYFGITGFSHLNSIWPLIDVLAERGHNVTVFTPYPTRKTKTHPNITTIVSTEIHQVIAGNWDADADLIRDRIADNLGSFWDTLFGAAIASCEIVLQSSQTHDMVHHSHFDLVILDAAHNECGIALAHYKYKAPFIAYTAVPILAYYYETYGLISETSAVSDTQYAYQAPLTFYEKLKSTLNALKWTFDRKYTFFNRLEPLVQEKLGLNHRPSFAQLNTETSLVLMNSFPTTDYARSLPPLFIPVGGMDISDKRNPLPTDIVKFLSAKSKDVGSSGGFVYVSFGTAVRISKTNADIRLKLFNAIGNTTSLKFIWKWEGAVPNDAPANVFFSDWLPQQDLIAHEDIKGVIGHGGINGIHEAVYFAVPMILFPIFADQDFNANSALSKGLAIKMEITSFTQIELENALVELQTNSRFKTNLKTASNVFRDRPMSAVDTALWWTEYVLRHKNTSLLMPLTRHQTWYERRLLDVWLFVFLTIQLVLAIIGLLIFKIYTIFYSPIFLENVPGKRSKTKIQ